MHLERHGLPSRNKVDHAGIVLKSTKPGTADYLHAIEIVNEWRVAHVYPINTFQARLRQTLKNYERPIAAQRLKRMPTIIDKLSRHPNMKLSTMQDIGGVRAVVETVEDVYRLVAQYENSKRFTHILKDKKDYIKSPKPDGYRGVHLIYRYRNTLARTERAAMCEGLMVEVQLRSKEQHIWATAVETVGMLLNQPFKTRGGDGAWGDFFAFVASAIAIVEQTKVLDKHKSLDSKQIYEKIKIKVDELHVFDVLSGYSAAVRLIEQNFGTGTFYHLIKLDTKTKRIEIKGFGKDKYKEAVAEYSKEEQNITPEQDVVLVSAGQLKELKKAYPNYFLDLRGFQERIRVIVEEIDQK